MSIVDDLELNKYKKELQRIENQELDLVFDPMFLCVCDRSTYEKNRNLMEWKCAICGKDILINKKRNDVENFVCDNCREVHNNTNSVIDKRILESRNKMFKIMENILYDELETKLST